MLKAALILAALTTAAAHSQVAPGYVPANPQGCKVWMSARFRPSEYSPKYSGGCVHGMAQGKGELRWVNIDPRYTEQTVWAGFFQDGVFVGDAPFPYRIEPQTSFALYFVHLPAIAAGDLIAVEQLNGEGKMEPCAPSAINLSLNGSVAPTDDAGIRRAMTEAGARVKSLCPANHRNTLDVNVYPAQFVPGSKLDRKLISADATYNYGSGQLSSYTNTAVADAKIQQNSAARDTRLAASRKRFDDFSTRNHIVSWVTLRQLDENPFRFEGKTVGVLAQLDRMLTPDTALLSGLGDDNGTVQLHGVDAGFPDHAHSELLAVRVGKREPLTGIVKRQLDVTVTEETPDRIKMQGSDRKQTGVTGVTRVDQAACAYESCSDWLNWLQGHGSLPWGEPFKPAP